MTFVLGVLSLCVWLIVPSYKDTSHIGLKANGNATGVSVTLAKILFPNEFAFTGSRGSVYPFRGHNSTYNNL